MNMPATIYMYKGLEPVFAYSGTVVGFATEGNDEEVYPVAIVADEDGNLESVPLALVQLDKAVRQSS